MDKHTMTVTSTALPAPTNKSVSSFIVIGFAFLLLCIASPVAVAQDSLPSWVDGPAKERIINFVERATLDGSPDFIPPNERIAVFDNDGTLWAEKPAPFQFLFAIDEVKRMVAADPALNDKEPYKSVAGNNMDNLKAMGKKAMAQIIALTHADMTTEEFSQHVKDWIGTAKHPQRGVPFTDLVYQPQLELLDFLREHHFKPFIVSGGGIEFMRVFAEKLYGIPPEQVIGSTGEIEYHVGNDGKPYFIKKPKMEFVDDGAGKPVGIHRFIGRRPVLAIGNSDGDLEMLRYTMAGAGPRLAIYIHHDDAEREYAYDRSDKLAKLDRGLDEATAEDWLIVSMKRDWAAIFPPTHD